MSKIVVAHDWIVQNKTEIQNSFLFLLTVLLGTFIKIYKEPNSPKKWRLSRIIAEIFVAFLVAGTIYQVNEVFLHFPKLFVMVLCVWGGSISGTFHDNVEDLVTSIFDSLKVFFSNKLQVIIFFLGFSFVIIGCKAKPIINTFDKQKITTIDILKEKTTDNNLAIIDSLKILISNVKTSNPECDSITNAKIDELLLQINSKKISGGNSFGVYYDKLKKELIAYAKIGATKTEITNENNFKTENLKEYSVKEIPVKYIPKWIQYLAIFGGLCGVFIFLFSVYKLKKIMPL